MHDGAVIIEGDHISRVGTILGGVVAARIWMEQSVFQWSLFRADALSALMIGIVTFTAAITGVYSVGYMRLEYADSDMPRVRLFYALFQLFVFTMLLAVTTDNLGLMWVAIEGTTLSTVFLVNLHDNHTGLEAKHVFSFFIRELKSCSSRCHCRAASN